MALLDQARALRPGGAITTTLLCMAGSPVVWQELAQTLTDFGAVTALDDSRPVLELATQGRPGLVLHGGTGLTDADFHRFIEAGVSMTTGWTSLLEPDRRPIQALPRARAEA